MTDEDFIIELFCSVNEKLKDVVKHPQAKLYPGEIVTIGVVFSLKGGGTRAFYRWFERNFKHLFPYLLK